MSQIRAGSWLRNPIRTERKILSLEFRPGRALGVKPYTIGLACQKTGPSDGSPLQPDPLPKSTPDVGYPRGLTQSGLVEVHS